MSKQYPPQEEAFSDIQASSSEPPTYGNVKNSRQQLPGYQYAAQQPAPQILPKPSQYAQPQAAPVAYTPANQNAVTMMQQPPSVSHGNVVPGPGMMQNPPPVMMQHPPPVMMQHQPPVMMQPQPAPIVIMAPTAQVPASRPYPNIPATCRDPVMITCPFCGKEGKTKCDYKIGSGMYFI